MRTLRALVRRETFMRQSAAVLLGSVAASGVSLARDVVVGREVGLGSALDAWTLGLAMLAFATTSLVTTTSASLLPAYARALSVDQRPAIERLAGAAAALVGAIGIVIALAVTLARGPIAAILTPDGETRDALEQVILILGVVAIPAVLVRGSLVALLNAHRRFLLAATSPGITAAFVIVSVLALGFDTPSWLAGAHCIGLAVEVLLLLVRFRTLGPMAVPDRRALSGLLSRIRSSAGSAWVGAVLLSVNPLIDMWFAGRLGEGEPGRLSLASRIPIAAAAISAAAIASPAFPRFVDAFARGTEVGEQLVRSVLRAAAAAGVFMSASIAAVSFPLSGILFSGGALTPADSRSVATVQVAYALTALPYVTTVVCHRALHAAGAYRGVALVGVIGCIVNVLGNALLGHLFGLVGIALSTAVVYATTTLGSLFYLGRQISPR